VYMNKRKKRSTYKLQLDNEQSCPCKILERKQNNPRESRV